MFQPSLFTISVGPSKTIDQDSRFAWATENSALQTADQVGLLDCEEDVCFGEAQASARPIPTALSI